MGDQQRSVRLLFGAAALIAITFGMFGMLGCTSGNSGSSATLAPIASSNATATAPAPSTTLGPATTVSPAASPAAVTTMPVDGAAMLSAALASMASGYHFTTTISVDGAVVLTADGDRVGDGTRLAVVRDDVEVQYVITPAGTWVQPEGGDWEELDASAATTDPIAALASPNSVTVDGFDGTTTRLSASVPATSLGIVADGNVIVAPVITNGVLTEVDYATTVDGRPALVQAVIGAVVDSSPVVAPV